MQLFNSWPITSMQLLSNPTTTMQSQKCAFTQTRVKNTPFVQFSVVELATLRERAEAGRRAQSLVRARTEFTLVVARSVRHVTKTFQADPNFLHVPLNEYRVITRVQHFYWYYCECLYVLMWFEVKWRCGAPGRRSASCCWRWQLPHRSTRGTYQVRTYTTT